MTPQERAAAMAADPAWDFAANPSKAVGHASTRAAQAHAEGRRDDARHWTHAGCLLVDAADNPHIRRGAVLADLVRTYGEP